MHTTFDYSLFSRWVRNGDFKQTQAYVNDQIAWTLDQHRLNIDPTLSRRIDVESILIWWSLISERAAFWSVRLCPHLMSGSEYMSPRSEYGHNEEGDNNKGTRLATERLKPIDNFHIQRKNLYNYATWKSSPFTYWTVLFDQYAFYNRGQNVEMSSYGMSQQRNVCNANLKYLSYLICING